MPGHEAEAKAGEQGRWGLKRVAASIAVLNMLLTAVTVISGPLIARALGPVGRGELAAIVVPLTVAPVLADLGLSTFVVTAVSKQRSIATILGSTLPVSVVIGALFALAGPFFAGVIAGGSDTVRLFLVIGFALMPLTLALQLLQSVNWARERWSVWLANRAIPPIGTLLAVIVLLVLDALTVSSAAIVILVTGYLSSVPILATLRWSGGLSWDRATAREAIGFGSRAYLFGIATMTNARLDQLLMTRAVSRQELGLYSVAVNLTSFQQNVSGAVVSAMFPRVSAGDAGLTARACRVTMWLVGAGSLVAIAVVGVLVTLLFGEEFEDATSMARILLLSAAMSGGTAVLASGLTASGLPGVAARGELLSLFITIPGLFVLLPPLGGDGAALVSLAAYTATFLYLLRGSLRHLGGTARDYLVPHRGDWSFVVERPVVQRLVQRLPLRRNRSSV